MSRPEFLYRGTPRKNVDQFTPKETVGSRNLARLVVSATSDKATATKFIVPIEDLNVRTGFLEGTHYYLCADEEKFRHMDQGGAIYTLPSNGFEYASEVDVWVNPSPVKPIYKEELSSGLEAMVKAGVRVFFVTSETLERFNESPESQLEILRTLLSENT